MTLRHLVKLLLPAAILVSVASCQQSTGKFELTGILKGIKDGSKVILTPDTEGEEPISDTTYVKNSGFIFTGDIPEPAPYSLTIEGFRYPLRIYAENAKITVTVDADSLKIDISGSSVNDGLTKYRTGLNDIYATVYKMFKMDSLSKLYRTTTDEKEKALIKKQMDTCSKALGAASDKYQEDYIRQNPASYVSAFLIKQSVRGKSATELEKELAMLDPKLNDSKVVKSLRDLIEILKTTSVDIGGFTNNAPEMSYAVDKTYTGAGYKDMTYLATLPNDNICALRKDGVVTIINPKGGKVGEFKTEVKGNPSAIAADESGNIYVFGSISEKKSEESRGRKFEVMTPIKVECLVFDAKGAKVRAVELAGVVTATGARVADGKIMVADTRGRMVAIFNAETGEKISAIEKLRTCCGILDFSIRNNEILVANLGAFRVNGFDYSGRPTLSFGQRGSGIDDFHGCCNPVSVAFLSNGGIVTVEKDPTRIKTYTKAGAKAISGIDELVKGCRYIPMSVDSKDNVYLASMAGGVIKCSPVKITK